MKRMFALLTVLALLSSAGLGFAEETGTDWKERLSTAVEGLREGVQEAGEKAAEAITETAEQLSETVSSAVGTVEEKVEEYSEQAVNLLKTAQVMAPIAVELGKQAVIEKVEDLSAQASDLLEDAKTSLPQFVEQAVDTAGEKLKELSERVSDILASVKSAAGQIQDIAGQKAGELAEKADAIAQTAKELTLSTLSSAYQSAVEKLKMLLDWLKGGETHADLVFPSFLDDSTLSGDQETDSPRAFYPVPGYGFYFGMPWKAARALNANWLADGRANAYERARALVMLNQQNTSLYFLWFVGETEDAPLFEVDEFAFAAQDTLVPPQGANGQYRFITTDSTVKQVYAEKERACGQRFGSASELGNGLLVSSLMFDENDAGISQAQVYLLQNQESAVIATHFVYTTDCGVNVLIFQYS